MSGLAPARSARYVSTHDAEVSEDLNVVLAATSELLRCERTIDLDRKNQHTNGAVHKSEGPVTARTAGSSVCA